MKPLSKINIKWTPKFAYALGLLTTDGNLYKDGRHFDFTSKDKILINIFKNCLGLNNKISKKSSGFNKEKIYHRIQFGDVNFYKWCLNFGLMPNKSKILGKLNVPDKYFFDFLRGCFDGDGGTYSYWDKRWKSSFMFYLSFASASLKFLEYLRKNIERLLGVRGHISYSYNRRAMQLKYAKQEGYVLISKMFYNKNIPYLPRKFNKIKKTFLIDKRAGDETGKRASLRG